jgi:hypothetical protein
VQKGIHNSRHRFNLTENNFFLFNLPIIAIISIISKATLEVVHRVGAVPVNQVSGNAVSLLNAVVNNHYVAALGPISRCEVSTYFFFLIVMYSPFLLTF